MARYPTLKGTQGLDNRTLVTVPEIPLSFYLSSLYEKRDLNFRFKVLLLICFLKTVQWEQINVQIKRVHVSTSNRNSP